jgi:pimeloyl-[acyl-carrier protein] methyl ester esterase
MSASAAATQIVFLPGFDGVAELREPFVRALDARHPARAIGYPNRALETLNGYVRFAASRLAPDARPVLVAESFSGLVAARWAAQDPHVAALVLCGAFARSPVPWAAIGASMPRTAQFLGANFLSPMSFGSSDAARKRWTEALAASLRAMRQEVIAERLRLIATEDVSRDLEQLRIPVVLLQFDDDLVIGAAARSRLESACPGAEIVRIPGPHFAIETRPRECAAALLPALAGFFDGPRAATGTS